MRKIDKVIYLNLERRTDRCDYILNEFERNSFPMDRVHQFKGHDGFKYPMLESIQEAMIADGFGASVSRRIENGLTWQTPADFACLWSKLCIYRSLVETGGDEVWMLLEDDCIIQKGWDYFANVVGGLPSDFRILQLDYIHPEEDLVKSPSYSSEFFHGFGGIGEHALIMTPSGARQLLAWSDTCEKNRFGGSFHIDSILWHHSFDVPEGCYYMKPGYITRPTGEDNDSDRASWIHKFASAEYKRVFTDA